MQWYEPGEDTYTLIDLLVHEGIAGQVVVDLGCSTGAITEVLEQNNFVISCDLNADALLEMSRASGPSAARSMIRADLLGGVNQDRIDVVVFNPPYVPDFDCPILGGGADGRAVIDRFVASVAAPLVYLLVIEANRPLEVIQNFASRGYRARVASVRRVLGETIVIIKAQRSRPDSAFASIG